MNIPEPDLLPLSMLNQIAYCERRFYLMHVLGEMEINAHVLEGTLRHAGTHQPGSRTEDETITHRQVYTWSEILGLAGYVDVIEEVGGQLYPIEYKKGRMGRWLSDHVQLCVQALCLEERLGISIESGAIFYFGSRRREKVMLESDLRQRTLAAIRRARALIDSRVLPDPIDQPAKCCDCSLEPVCLPEEVFCLRGVRKINDDSTVCDRTV